MVGANLGGSIFSPLFVTGADHGFCVIYLKPILRYTPRNKAPLRGVWNTHEIGLSTTSHHSSLTYSTGIQLRPAQKNICARIFQYISTRP